MLCKKIDIFQLYDLLSLEFKKIQYKNVFKKIWFYNEKTLVLDFSYNRINFAYDFNIEEGGIKVYFVDREYKLLDRVSKKSNLNLDHNLSIIDNLKQDIYSTLSKIDNKYKFKLTVIIPVYNRESIIKPCIDSINEQSLDKKDFEVIFVDDCSTDHTVEKINSYINKEINFKILHRPVGSGNASSPRNDGIKAAQGKYIFFLDSDDKIHKDTLYDGVNLAQNNNSDLVYFKLVSDTGRLVPIRPYKLGNVDYANIVKNHLMRSLSVFKIFNRDMLLDNNIKFNPSINVAEDKVFMLDVLCVATRISILADKPYYCATLHEGEHLSRSGFDIDDMINIVNNGFLKIYSCSRSKTYKSYLYNAWLIIALEQINKMIIVKNRSNSFKKENFLLMREIASIGFELILRQYIYKEFLHSLDLLIDGDFEKFFNYIKSK